MKTQSIFNLLLTGAIVSTITFTSCESGDNRADSNSEKTEGDVNDPTKNTSDPNTSTRTGGSIGMNEQGQQTSSELSENTGSNTQTNGSNTTGANNKNSGTTIPNTSGTSGTTGKASGTN